MSGLFKVPAKWSGDILGWVYVGALVVRAVVNIATDGAAWPGKEDGAIRRGDGGGG